jgi:two-component system LytT family sensor kinase
MNADSDLRWRWPSIHLGAALVLLLASLALGMWKGSTVALEMQVSGDNTPWSRPMLWEITGAVAGWAVLWIPMAFTLNFPRPSDRWRRFIGFHLLGWLIYWAVKSLLMLTPRFALYRIFGWGAYRYPDLPKHLAMEAMKDLLSYTLIALAYLAWRLWREREEERLRQAQLESELRDAQLRQLTGQLDPHFLFNALNTVSSLMYEDLPRTDALLTDLGQLLRASLERRGPTWSLGEEEDHLGRYSALLLARFGERLSIEVRIDPSVRNAEVPRFCLQRLLENAVKHNQDRALPMKVWIDARREGEGIRLQVSDDGEGFKVGSAALTGDGHGLRGLKEVLNLLHGARASLSLGARPGGGAEITFHLPLKEAP